MPREFETCFASSTTPFPSPPITNYGLLAGPPWQRVPLPQPPQLLNTLQSLCTTYHANAHTLPLAFHFSCHLYFLGCSKMRVHICGHMGDFNHLKVTTGGLPIGGRGIRSPHQSMHTQEPSADSRPLEGGLMKMTRRRRAEGVHEKVAAEQMRIREHKCLSLHHK